MSDAPDTPETVDLPLRPREEPETATPPSSGPRCGYCGSPSLHESKRGGFREKLLRLFGASLYRCDTCHRRFAFAVLGRPERHRSSRQREADAALVAAPHARTARGGRGRALGVLTTLFIALLTYAVASWLIRRAEERRLDEVSQPAEVPQD